MKNLLLIAAILFNISLSSAQWKWKNPLPPENQYNALAHLTDDRYVSGGDNLILITKDGGLTWKQTEHPSTGEIHKFWFTDPHTGFAVGDDGIILKTDDGGLNWEQKESGSTFSLMDVFFLNPLQGYISGSGGRILSTTDGGETWTETELPGAFQSLVSIRFCDEQTGYVAGRNGLFAQTTDAGETWTILHEQLHFYWIHDMHLIDAQTLLLASWGGIFKSTDGGQQWTEILAPSGEEFEVFLFIDENTGYALSNLSRIYKTTDKGNTWTNTQLLDDYYLCSSCDKAMAFSDEHKGIVASYGNLSWIDLESETYDNPFHTLTTANLTDAAFSNDTTVFAVGFGAFLVSRTNGRTWEPLPVAQSGDSYNRIQFLDEHTGYISGRNFLDQENDGVLVKTNDGGESWEPIFTTERSFRGKHFVDTVTGYLLGQDGIIYKTTDGGYEWLTLTTGTGTGTQLNSIFFTSAENGFVCGSSGAILRTTDGGQTWTAANQATNQNLFSIYFVSDSVGFAASRAQGIVKTTNGGDSWQWLPLTGAPNNYIMNDLLFTTPEKGYLIGNVGYLFVTTDGGESWEFDQLPGKVSFSGLASGHENTVVAVGMRGGIIRKYTGPEEHPLDDDDEDDEDDNPTFIALPQDTTHGTVSVFPNPFSAEFTVKGSFNNNHVTVEIFDLQGRRHFYSPGIRTQSPSIKINLPNLREGMYLLRITDGADIRHAKILKKP